MKAGGYAMNGSFKPRPPKKLPTIELKVLPCAIVPLFILTLRHAEGFACSQVFRNQCLKDLFTLFCNKKRRSILVMHISDCFILMSFTEGTFVPRCIFIYSICPLLRLLAMKYKNVAVMETFPCLGQQLFYYYCCTVCST